MAPKKKTKQPEIFLAIDVECVATGCGHLDRTPVSVAICSESEELIFSELISPKFSVHNYLTGLTGFEANHFQGARSFADVMADVRAHLGPNVVLVGQGIENDIRWLEVNLFAYILCVLTVCALTVDNFAFSVDLWVRLQEIY